MSSTCTIGRQGVPSLLISTLPVATACAVKLFSTMSQRSRGDRPYAVALRRITGQKAALAISSRSFSARTFETPYAVTGLNGASSVKRWWSSDAP